MTAGFSKRAVLRAGYGAVMVVLGLSAVEAYRIQISVSEQHLDIYRRYALEAAHLSTLRRNLWLAGNDIRDFFLHSTPAQAAILRAQLTALRAEDERSLARIAAPPELSRKLDQFWAVVEPVPSAMLRAPNARQIDFVQRIVVPEREELYTQLMDLAAEGQMRLQRQEAEFAETRRLAARRLSAMLALGLLLSLGVALFSIRHAENLERTAESQYAEAEQTKRELQQLSARLLEVEEEGRRKLSRELHDEIGQTLALLQIEISHAAASPSRERLERARAAGRALGTIYPQYFAAIAAGPARRFGTGPRAAISARGFSAAQRYRLRVQGTGRGRRAPGFSQNLRLSSGAGSAAQLREAFRRVQCARERAPISGLADGRGRG